MAQSSVSSPALFRSMGLRTRTIAQAVGRRIIPTGGELPFSFDDTGSLEFIDKYLRDLGGGALGLKALLWVFDLLPVLFIFKPRRFVNLSSEDQDLYLLNWQESRIYYRRMIVVLLKTICCMGYYSDPQVLDAMGYYQKCHGAEQS